MPAPQVKAIADKSNTIYTSVAERSARHGLEFAGSELLQVKEWLAAHAGRKPANPTPLVPTQYRLPGTVVPTNYELLITPRIEPGRFHYGGTVIITAEVKDYTRSIVMHAHKDLEVVLLMVSDAKTDEMLPVYDRTFNPLSEMYTIHMETGLFDGMEIKIAMQFLGQLKKDKLGFYLSDYVEGSKWK